MRRSWTVVIALAMAGCGSSTKPPVKTTAPAPAAAPGATTAEACAADGLGELRVGYPRPACGEDAATCAPACDADDAGACMSMAYAREADGDYDAARVAYGRACRFGLAIGCTNLGAHLWLPASRGTPADVACARRLFEAACVADERYACAMVGRMMAAAATTPATRAAARAYFDQLCSDAGGVACRMYAYHLEQGDLGDASAGEIAPLLQRACDTGDRDACGHTTAAEIFR